MVTEHTNIVYTCNGCGIPLRFSNGSAYSPPGWFHLSNKTPCPGLEPVEVRLTPSVRVPA